MIPCVYAINPKQEVTQRRLSFMSQTPKQTRPTNKKNQKPALNFLLMGAGSMFTSMVVAGFIVGYVFDTLFDTLPIFLLLCGFLGFIGGIMKVHKLLGKMDLYDQQKPDQAVDTQKNKDVDSSP